MSFDACFFNACFGGKLDKLFLLFSNWMDVDSPKDWQKPPPTLKFFFLVVSLIQKKITFLCSILQNLSSIKCSQMPFLVGFRGSFETGSEGCASFRMVLGVCFGGKLNNQF